MLRAFPALCFAALASTLTAAEPPKRIPPAGVPVPEEVRLTLGKSVVELGKEIGRFQSDPWADSKHLAQLPSVLIFHKAASWALLYDEFFDPKEFEIAQGQIAQGKARLAALSEGKIPWNTAKGLVIRGYQSQVDGSVQPYGLVLPADFQPEEKTRRPLHIWFHGRAEKLSELAFIHERQHHAGEFTPEGAIVLHLYGRFCNANKFAGEVDAIEAMRDVSRHYAIDPQRVVARGFSMGGASVWHMAVHHSKLWAAAAPGAGFAETQEFFKVFAPGKTPPPWWEMVLWRWYDATVYARNLTGLPVIAYSGETDGQKQAAEIMLRFAAQEGITFPHVIGPQTGHKYHPDSKPQIEKFIADALAAERPSKPREFKFTTYSLVYPGRAWATIDRMEKQWERADLDVSFDGSKITATTKNIAAIRMELPEGSTTLQIDGTEIPVSGKAGAFNRLSGTWQAGAVPPGGKRAYFAGPIDHAFMSRFLHVKPTGAPLHEAAGTWAKNECEHATSEWRHVFRGDAPIKDDTALTDDDIKANNLILWGDPSSNAVLRRILGQLPLKWTKESLEFRGYRLDAANYVPILILPNPLNPQKYIVLNSGHTFREKAALNNSDQTPKLPDWAIVDLRVPPNDQWPGLIYDAGFFNEDWK